MGDLSSIVQTKRNSIRAKCYVISARDHILLEMFLQSDTRLNFRG